MVKLSLGVAAAFAGAVSAFGLWPNGNGKIYLIRFVKWQSEVDAAKGPTFACLDDHGGATQNMDNCAVFNKDPNTPYAASTSAGPCTFYDSNWIENTDNDYGISYFAFHCAPGLTSAGENWVIPDDPSVPLFWLDDDVLYDVKFTDPQGSNPIWSFAYPRDGGDGVQPGHDEVYLKWVGE